MLKRSHVPHMADHGVSPQCLLVLERLCVWISGGEELCVWNKDFQLQCHKQNHSDTGEHTVTVKVLLVAPAPLPPDSAVCTQTDECCRRVCWHFAGITALIELPKNCLAAAMDKEIGERL